MANLRNVKTRLEVLLPVLKARLVDQLSWHASLVYLSLDPDVSPRQPTSDTFIVLVPRRFPVWEQLVTGGGNTTLSVEGTVEMHLFHRVWLDESERDDTYLTDTTLGVLVTWRAALKALQMWDPKIPSSEDYYLEEPMRVTPGGWENAGRRPRDGWGRLTASFEMKFLQDLS